MEEEVAVDGLVEAALGIEEAGVHLELLGMAEGLGELVDDAALLGGQLVGKT